MAHIMTTLRICRQTGSTPYFLFRPGSHYDGAVIHGVFTLTRIGSKVVESVTSDDVEAEMAEFGFHGSVLQEVRTLCGIQVPIEQITTMRYLQELVMAGGEPGGQIKNRVLKKLPKLSFDERPLTINVDSFTEVFRLLSLPTDAPLPRTLYLHHEDFFCTDRTRVILSAFGSKVPCFSFNGRKIMATSLKGRNATNAASYTSDPPKVLQVKSLPMASATTQWTSMMKGGWIITDPEIRVTGTRVFRSQEKIQMWKMLGKFLHDSVSQEMDTTSTAETGNQGRKRRFDDDEVVRKSKRGTFTV